VLTHDDLVRLVWGGRSTTPETVTQRVKLLRDALGDDAQQPRYVGLVRGGGYRLLPPVERLGEPSASAPQGRDASHAVPADVPTGGSASMARRSPRSRTIALTSLSVALLASIVIAAVLLMRLLGSSALRAPLSFEMTQLTSSGRAAVPAISPKGDFIVYRQSGENGFSASLRLRQIGTTDELELVAGDEASVPLVPTVAPDGKFIYYGKDIFGKGRELWRISFLGRDPKFLRHAVSSPIGWSPDGKHGAFVSFEGTQSTSLVEVDEEFHETELGKRTVPEHFVSLNIVGFPPARPAYSPDGRLIAIAELSDLLGPRIAVIDRETGAVQTYDSQASFVPNGIGWLGPSTLVLSQPAAFGQRSQLFAMSYPDGVITTLTNDLASYVGVDLDGSRTRLVTMRVDLRTSIWLADGSNETAVELVPPTPFGTPNVFLAWSGDRLLYDSTFGGHAAIVSVPIGGGTPEEVVADAFHVAAAADGSAIVFVAGTREREGLWKVDASGKRAVLLAPGFAVEPVVTVDRKVVYVSNRNGTQSPWMVPLDGGEPTEIVPEHANAIDVTPDGGRLAFLSLRDGQELIVVCELPSCSSSNRQELPVPPNIAGAALRWTHDGEIAYIESTAQNIWAVPLDGRPPHALTTFTGDPRPIQRFAWSRDGRLAFIRRSVELDAMLLTFAAPAP
jgi:Tol biopolymer transport system component